MTRAAARVNHDEIVRMVKAVQRCGLPIGEVVYENGRVRLVIGVDSGQIAPALVDEPDPGEGLLVEPKL